jgi:ATP-dependent DNA helicase RecQ
LIEYFGEAATPCGICSHCRAQTRGESSLQVEPLVAPQITATERQLIAQLQSENHAALRQTRQLARFLCGLPSPATARSSLRQHKAFGALDKLGFQQLLAPVQH